MTNFTQTISLSVNCFGASPPSLWNSYNWAAFKWGYGTATVPKTVRMQVGPANLSVASTQAVDFRLVKLLSPQTITPSATKNAQFVKAITASITPTNAMVSETLQDPRGYYRFFPEGVTNDVLGSTPNWAAATSTPVTWNTSAVVSATWS